MGLAKGLVELENQMRKTAATSGKKGEKEWKGKGLFEGLNSYFIYCFADFFLPSLSSPFLLGSGSREQFLAFKATILLGKVLSLSNTLLPSSQCARLQTLEELVKRSLMFRGDPQRRSR